MEWINAPDDITIKDVGFVYRIHELNTGMDYIGCKKFWRVVKYKPLKGKKNRRIKYIESDWREYNSSNKEIQKKIQEWPENYHKIMLSTFGSVADMKAYEAYLQLQRYFNGEWNTLYNEVINLRMRIRKGDTNEK